MLITPLISPHFTDKETEIQRGEGMCPKSQSLEIVELGLEPRSG